jgi:DNA invertase Pin-like site-specific DNA recombinase
MKRAAILTRVSTEKQKTDRQILELENYCGQKGFRIIKVISSVVSGRKTDRRPDLDEILELASGRKFDILIVTEISRISRKPEILQSFITKLKRYNIPILFKNLGLMSIDENGKESFATNVIISIFSELAAEEVRQLSDRVKSGLDAARARGKNLGRPEGKDTRAEILRKHSKIVKYLQDGMSLPETAKLTGASYNTCKKVKSLIS